jgi:hypothetical protein
MSANGVVLRGVGPSSILSCTGTSVPIHITGTGGASATGTTFTFTDTYVPLGATSFNVNATGLVVGNTVIIHRPWTASWITAMQMDATFLGTEAWAAGTGAGFERTIMAVSGNNITIDIPLPTPFEQVWCTGNVRKFTDTGRIQNDGIENLTLFNTLQPTSGPDAIDVDNAKNCWIKNVVMDGYENGIELNGGVKWVTVQDCVYQNGINIGSARPGIFNTSGQMCLYQRCTAISGFEHIIITQDSTAGPNVFLNIHAVNASSFDGGPHQKWALGVLMDNVSGPISALKIYNATTEECQQPPVDHHYNFIMGGVSVISSESDQGTFQNTGTIISPKSLYLEQLKERLGTSALQNIGYPRFAGNYKILNRNSGKAVEVAGASTADGAAVVQLPFSGASDRWQMIDLGSGYYEIKNANSGKGLAVQGASGADGALLVQNTYAPSPTNAAWIIKDVGNGFSEIVNRLSGKAVDVPGASTADNTALDQATYTGASNQQFLFVSVP